MNPKPSPPFGYRHGTKRQEPDPLEQLVLRMTRETIAAGGNLRDVASALAAAVCFECGQPAVCDMAVVPGGKRRVPLCGKCAHSREPLGPGEDSKAAFQRIDTLDLSANEFLQASMLVAMEQYRRDAVAEEQQT